MTASNDPRSFRQLPIVQIASALVGIGLSLYLLAQHTRLKSGIQGGASFCSFGRHADCDLVNSSRYSEILGVPLAAIGAVYFFALLILALLSPKKTSGFSTPQTWVLRLSSLGILFDSFLLGLQVFAIQSVCLLCVTTYFANFVVFASSLIRGREGRPWAQAFASGLRGEPGGPPLFPSSHTKALTAIASVFFVTTVALVPYALRLASKNYTHVNDAIQRFFETWPEKKSRTIEWKQGDGIKGDPAAPVRMVIFSDFQCPFCRGAAFTLHAALEPVKDKVFLVFKHYPLDQECNPALTYQLHPHACELARLGYCAGKKGKFWDYHDIVFLKLSEGAVSEGVEKIAKSLAAVFTPEEIQACLRESASLRNAEEDIRLGRTLDVRGTPSVFVNGKAVTIPLSVENVRRLVNLEASLARSPR